MDNSIIGERIKQLRTKSKLNQQNFAEAIGVTQSTLSSYENGNVIPSIDILIKTSKQFNVSMDWLCGLSSLRSEFTTLEDVAKMIFQLDDINELRYELEINDRLPNDLETEDNKWYAALKFFGNDKEHPQNHSICQLLGSFDDVRSEFDSYFSDRETYDYRKDRILQVYSDIQLTKRVPEELSFKERLKRRDALLEDQLAQKKSTD